MSLDHAGCNWHIRGDKGREPETLSPTAEAQQGHRSSNRWHPQDAHTRANDGRTPATGSTTNAGTTRPPRAHPTRNDRCQSCARLRPKDGSSATEEGSKRSPKPRTKEQHRRPRQQGKSSPSQPTRSTVTPRSERAQRDQQHQLAPTSQSNLQKPGELEKGLETGENRW